MTQPDLSVAVSAGQLSAVSRVMKLAEIRTALPQLEAACNAKLEVAESFGDLCKLVALKAGVDPAVLATYITAVCKDTLKKTEAKTEQLTLLFEELR